MDHSDREQQLNKAIERIEETVQIAKRAGDHIAEICVSDLHVILEGIKDDGCGLRWKKEKPTAPGWYWYRNDAYDEPQIVELLIVHGRRCVSFSGSDITHWIDDPGFPLAERLMAGEWAGPIPLPSPLDSQEAKHAPS